jgi:hypothetical protein
MRAKKIKNFIEIIYKIMVEEFKDVCKKGESKGVNIIINAIGEVAFKEKWFCDGLKNLFSKKKELKIPKLKIEHNYQKMHEDMRRFEKKLSAGKTQNEALSFFKYPSKIKTQYFRDFPKKLHICCFHYCYGLLHDELHEQILSEDIPQWDIDLLNKNLAIAEEIISD